MAEIEDWLRALGLEKYVPIFDRHEIDLNALTHLTEDDLKEIGLPLGPRRKILAARSVSSPPPTSVGFVAAAPAGERRHLTVMFVDLVGSTSLSTHTDPEALSETLKEYKRAAAAEIAHYGGTVAKYLGDGILAYFGWPRAREDAAECSLHAAFAVIARVGRLRDPLNHALQSRVGIATGLVVVGEVTGEGTAREDSVAGETLNLAARLESIAEPDGVFISENTRRIVGSLFDCESLGERELKGFDRPMSVWRVKGESAHASRFSAVRATHSTLVGREPELAILRQRWGEACDGEGRAVLLLGEAGIGKSRLTDALYSEVRAAPHAYICWQCSAYHENNAFYPVAQYILGAAGIADADTPSGKLEKLVELLNTTRAPLDRALPLFADLLSIPTSAGYAAPSLAPAQRKTALIAALSDWIARIAETNPMLLVLEDAHWIDATTQDLMTRLIHGAAGTPILIAITARPSFASPWSGRAQVSIIVLHRLTNRQCGDLVQELVSKRAVLPTLLEQIVAKGDGNPLFLEELTKATLETNSAGVPDTLQDSLMARLDQLGSVKQTAQIASVLGRRFARPLLSLVTALPPETLDADLSQLIAAEIIYPIGRMSDGHYEFKHALMRDAAYDSLLLAHRRELHENCAQLLAREFPEVAELEPELLALHSARAGRPAEARLYSTNAGDRAAAQYAYVEAINNYRAALAQLALLPADRQRDEFEMAIQLKLGGAYVIIQGAQHRLTRDAYARAKTVGETLDNPDALFKATWGVWFSATLARDWDVAALQAEDLVILSRRSGDDSHFLEGLHCRWSSSLFRGDCDNAIADGTQGQKLYDPERHHALSLTFGGHDPGVCAYCVSADASMQIGLTDTGTRLIAKGTALAEKLGQPLSTGHAFMNGSIALAIARDYAGTMRHAEKLLEVANRFNFPPQIAVANYLLGWAEAFSGDAQRGLARMEVEFERVTALGPMPILLTSLYAQTILSQGRAEDSLALLDRTIADLQFPDLGLYLPELHRIRADCLLVQRRTEEALRALVRADALADAQGAKLLKLRIAMCSFKAQTALGTPDMARTALKTLADTFTEGRALPDLMEANALL